MELLSGPDPCSPRGAPFFQPRISLGSSLALQAPLVFLESALTPSVPSSSLFISPVGQGCKRHHISAGGASGASAWASSHEQPGGLLQGLGSPSHCHWESRRKPLPSSSPQPSSRFMADGHASFLAEQMRLQWDAPWVQVPNSSHLHLGATVGLSLGNGLQSSDNCNIRCPAYLRHLT